MDELLNSKSIKADFEAQVTAALMIQSNALACRSLMRHPETRNTKTH